VGVPSECCHPHVSVVEKKIGSRIPGSGCRGEGKYREATRSFSYRLWRILILPPILERSLRRFHI
jgi:hypothetical protein